MIAERRAGELRWVRSDRGRKLRDFRLSVLSMSRRGRRASGVTGVTGADLGSRLLTIGVDFFDKDRSRESSKENQDSSRASSVGDISVVVCVESVFRGEMLPLCPPLALEALLT